MPMTRIKRRRSSFGRRGKATQEYYKDVVKSFREKIRRAIAQSELNLGTAVKEKKNASVNTSTTKGGQKNISTFW